MSLPSSEYYEEFIECMKEVYLKEIYLPWLIADAVNTILAIASAAGDLGDLLSSIIIDSAINAFPPPLPLIIDYFIDPASIVRLLLLFLIFYVILHIPQILGSRT